MNPTVIKFGYPASLLREYDHWVVLLRPAQATLGSLVIACKADVTSAGEMGAEAWAEMAQVTAEVEGTLSRHFPMAKINYLMLMMVDLEVHQHVIPRYEEAPSWSGKAFEDPGWPGVPNLGHTTDLTPEELAGLTSLLRDGWVDAGSRQS